MVRISSGRLKGRKVVTSKKIFTSTDGDELRPTSSKVREAIFNIFQTEIDQAIVSGPLCRDRRRGFRGIVEGR